MTPLIYLQITIGFMIETFVLGFLYVKVGERERERERETERERDREGEREREREREGEREALFTRTPKKGKGG